MPKYRQITSGERYAIQALRKQGLSLSAIAAHLGRAPSTVSREIRRNLSSQGRYTPFKADQQTRARRSRSRRNARFRSDDWVLVEHLVSLDWSPEQVSGWLSLHDMLSISLRDDLLANLGGQARRRRPLAAPAAGDEEAPKAQRVSRFARKTRR